MIEASSLPSPTEMKRWKLRRRRRRRSSTAVFLAMTVYSAGTAMAFVPTFPNTHNNNKKKSSTVAVPSTTTYCCEENPVQVLLTRPSLEELRYYQQQQRQDDLRSYFPISQDQRYNRNKRKVKAQTDDMKETVVRPAPEELSSLFSSFNTTTTATWTTENTQQQQQVSSSTSSRSSTMPGFPPRRKRKTKNSARTKTDNRHDTASSPTLSSSQQQQQQHPTHALYIQSPNVPDSMIQFTQEIHSTTGRITQQEEMELGYKTQAAVRLQRQYDVLHMKLQREPTDEEWCAAAGKINMAAIRETLEEGKWAKEQLVTSNLRMVQSVVHTYLRNGLSAQYNAGDMMQEGIVALIKAAEKFEPQRGWKFSTYAMYWVRSSVKHNQLQQANLVWVPQRLQEQYKRMRVMEQELSVTLQRKPTREELADAMKWSVEQLEHCRVSVERQTVSLDAPLRNHKQPMKDDTSTAIQDYIVDRDTASSRTTLRHDLWDTMHRHLDATQVELLSLRYCVTPTQSIAEIARQVQMKPDQVRRTIHKSLELLRNVEEMEYFERAFLHY